MESNHDLDKLEKKTASVIFQDGIFDMTLGLVLVAFGIASLLYNYLPDPWDSLFGFLLYIVIAIPLFLIQFLVTKPRLGIVKFGAKRKKINFVIIAVGVVLLLSNIVVFILIFTNILQFTGNVYLMAVIFGLIPLTVFTLMAYFMSFKRLYLIGTIFSISFTMKEILTIQDFNLIGNILFLSLGVIIIVIGLVCLIRFLKKYPKVPVIDHEFREITSQQ
ncbi:MAG: hypothetical protein FK734_18340 [Asgard group archaeon]|nr:hypothetical protein [Asgard group archaeon]